MCRLSVSRLIHFEMMGRLLAMHELQRRKVTEKLGQKAGGRTVVPFAV